MDFKPILYSRTQCFIDLYTKIISPFFLFIYLFIYLFLNFSLFKMKWMVASGVFDTFWRTCVSSWNCLSTLYTYLWSYGHYLIFCMWLEVYGRYLCLEFNTNPYFLNPHSKARWRQLVWCARCCIYLKNNFRWRRRAL